MSLINSGGAHEIIFLGLLYSLQISNLEVQMARLPRITIPHIAHQITQRGNRRQQPFFTDAGYQKYLDLLKEWSFEYEVEISAYCLMPNHIHVIAVLTTQEGLSGVMKEVHS
jgi:putative transposase